jgi:hypothetical protein
MRLPFGALSRNASMIVCASHVSLSLSASLRTMRLGSGFARDTPKTAFMETKARCPYEAQARSKPPIAPRFARAHALDAMITKDLFFRGLSNWKRHHPLRLVDTPKYATFAMSRHLNGCLACTFYVYATSSKISSH